MGASWPQGRGRRRQVQDSARAGDKPQGRDPSQVLEDPRRGPPLSPWWLWHLLPQSPFQNGREGRLQSLGRVEVKQCRSGVQRTPHCQALERCHALKEPTPLPCARKTPSFLSCSSPSQGWKRGTQTCQLRSGVGG